MKKIVKPEELRKQGFIYDPSKRMWYRHTSRCCDAPLKQKMLYKDKIVTDPNFKLIETGIKKVKETVREEIPLRKHFWQFWVAKMVIQTKIVIKKENYQKPKHVTYNYFCTTCDKTNGDKWEYVTYDGNRLFWPDDENLYVRKKH